MSFAAINLKARSNAAKAARAQRALQVAFAPKGAKPREAHASLQGAPSQKERAALLAKMQEEGVSRYEARMKASGRATRIVLPSGGVFWSRGYRGCPHCEQPVDIQVELQPFALERDGATTIGWRCRRTLTPTASESSLQVP